jgi:squalene synthase HpnC
VVTGGLAAAYASCEQSARAHYENFPVASILLPARMRPHVAAVYAFARAADDFADEGERPPEQRIRLLDGWRERLRRSLRDEAQPAAEPGEPTNAVAIFQALGNTVHQCGLPPELLDDLLSAFKQDVTVHRYHNWEALFDYARRSANPVGRLVLRIAGHCGPTLDAWSDSICTALQFTNFWQDFTIDCKRGRLYLPQSELVRQGVADADVSSGAASGPTRRALGHAIGRTRQLFVAGRPLCDAVSGRLRYELRATWLGGIRILDRVETQLESGGFHRPALQIDDAPWFVWRMLTWTAR